MRKGKRAAIYLGGALAGYGALCWWLSSVYLSPRNVAVPTASGLEEIRLPGNVPATVTPDFGGREVCFVFAHGYRGSRFEWADVMRDLRARGFDAIAPAMPGQDGSPKTRVGFGRDEAVLVDATARFARVRGARRVVAVGLSMGGAAVWLASEKGALDAVVSEDAFPTLDEATARFLVRINAAAPVLLKPMVWLASWRSGISPGEVRPVDAARRWRGRPALVVHGAEDRLFPVEFSRRLAEAAGAPLWVIPGAAHPEGHHVAREEFVARLVRLARTLPPAPPSARARVGG